LQNTTSLIWSQTLRPYALALALGVVLCCGRDDASLARDVTRAVDTFHEQLNARDYERIWDGSHELLRTQGKEGFIGTLKNLREQLGRLQSSQRAEWGVHEVSGTNAGTYVEARYNATFELGVATERFTWKVEGSGVLLAGLQVTNVQLATGHETASQLGCARGREQSGQLDQEGQVDEDGLVQCGSVKRQTWSDW